MAGYLETYGAGAERRERHTKQLLLILAIILVAGGSFYFWFRNYRETRQAKLFFELLAKKDYKAAYALWGCTDATPCPNYDFSKFMEDWGPESDHSNPSSVEFTRIRGCATGVIVEVNFGGGVIEYLWVDRKTRDLGFAPFPVCNPRYRPGAE